MIDIQNFNQKFILMLTFKRYKCLIKWSLTSKVIWGHIRSPLCLTIFFSLNIFFVWNIILLKLSKNDMIMNHWLKILWISSILVFFLFVVPLGVDDIFQIRNWLCVCVDNWESIGVIWSPANIFLAAHFNEIAKKSITNCTVYPTKHLCIVWYLYGTLLIAPILRGAENALFWCYLGKFSLFLIGWN